MDAQALGRYLRESREARELRLEDVETALKIRLRILEAFERGEFEPPELSAVQVRGFIRNYARYLHLDAEKIVGYYEMALVEAHQTPKRRQKPKQNNIKRDKRRTTGDIAAPVAKQAITDTNPTLPPVPETHITLEDMHEHRRRRRSQALSRTVLFLAAAAAISVIAFVSYEVLSTPIAAEFVDVPDIINTETSTPTYTPLPTSTALQQAALPTERAPLPQVYDGTGVMVSVLMRQRTWVRFVVDGEERFVGVAPPDATLEGRGLQQIEVSASNAEALIITYNGEPQRTLGQRGQRVDIVFTPAEMEVSSGAQFAPTSEFTATPPPTSEVDVNALIEAQTPSSTPGPSPTPSLTFTPSNTPPPTNTPTDTPPPTNTPTITPTIGPSATPTATFTITPTETPSLTPQPTLTPTPSAVLPLRATQPGLTPTKGGG